jgi:phage terminase small subunit
MAGSRRPEKISAKQLLFVDAFMVNPNEQEAAAKAGYADPTYGWQLVRNPMVSAEIARRREEMQQETKIDLKKWLGELATIAFLDINTVFDCTKDEWEPIAPNQLSETARHAISGIKIYETIKQTVRKVKGKKDRITTRLISRRTEVKLWDKHHALDSLAKHYGWLIRGDMRNAVITGNTINTIQVTEEQKQELLRSAMMRLGFKPPEPVIIEAQATEPDLQEAMQ